MTASFNGQTYTATAGERFGLPPSDLTAIGEATTVDPPGAVANRSVLQIGEIPPTEAIAIAAASDQPAPYLIFLGPDMASFPAELCAFADPANPPSEVDCP